MSETQKRGIRLSGKELASYAISKGAPGIIMLVAVPLWTTAFGTSEYAHYSIAWSLSGVIGALLSGWIRQATLRYAGNSTLSPHRLPRWLMPLLIGTSWLLAIVALPAAVKSPHATHAAVLYLATCAYLAISVLLGVRMAYAQRERQASRYAAAEATRLSIALLASVLVGLVPTIPGSAAILIGYSVGGALALVVLPKRPRNVERSRSVAHTYWRFGWPMALWLALSSVLVYVDRVIVNFALGADRAGAYAAAADLVIRGFAMATFPVTMTLHPIVMRAWNIGERDRAISAVKRHTLILLGWTASGTLLVSVAGPSLISAIAHIPPPSRGLLVLLSLGGALWQIALISHKPLEMADRSRLMAVLMLFSVLITCLGSVALVRLWEETGVAAGLTGGALSYVALSMYFGNRSLQEYRQEGGHS